MQCYFHSHLYQVYKIGAVIFKPLNGSHRVIAPYLADVDLRGTGRVFYRQTTDPSLLARATSEIRAAFSNSQHVTIKHLLIVTWYRVGYYDGNFDKVHHYHFAYAIECCKLIHEWIKKKAHKLE